MVAESEEKGNAAAPAGKLPDGLQQWAAAHVLVARHQRHAFGAGGGADQPIGRIAREGIRKLCRQSGDFQCKREREAATRLLH